MNERDLFIAARQLDSVEQRQTLLAKTCGADAQLYARVSELLQAEEQAGSFLRQPALAIEPAADWGRDGTARTELESDPVAGEATTVALDFLAPSRHPGSLGCMGQYEITEFVGSGGMGIVLKASDPKLNRVVAIKVLAPELGSNVPARRRFMREGQAAAAIAHPHIVTIFAVDEDRLPYLVMEYVDGVSLQEKIDRDGHLDLKETLRIGAQIAAGLSAAHAQGVIHRDIKPANILLENGVERVRITDFGLARAIDDATVTQAGEVAGTPQYMSPEQAQGQRVDARSDLFSLGCLLYSLCTGRSPFRAETSIASLRRVCDDTPLPIQDVNPGTPEWLSAIIARLLEKLPEHRIQTAAEVADLLNQHLAHLQNPTVAPAPGAIPPRRQRSKTGVRHRRWLVAGFVLAVATVTLGTTEAVGVTQFTTTIVRIVTGEGTLVIEVDDPEAQVSLDGEVLSIRGAGLEQLHLRPGQYRFAATRDGQPVETRIVTITRGGKEIVRVQREPPAAAADTGDEVRRYDAHSGSVWAVAISPDGTQVAYGGEGATVWVCDVATGKEQCRFTEHQRPICCIAFSPDGRRVLSAGHDTTIDLWDAVTGKALRSFRGHAECVWCVAFSPDGRVAASGGGGRLQDGKFVEAKDTDVRLWNVETGQELGRLTGHNDYVLSVAFSPDGTRLMTSCANADPIIRLWDLASGQELRRFEGHTLGNYKLAFSRDGQQALSASADRTIRLWNVASGEQLQRFHGHQSDVTDVAFLPDDRRILSCSWDRTLRLWDLSSGREVRRISGHAAAVRSVAPLPDGRFAISGSEDGTVRMWRLPVSSLTNDAAPASIRPLPRSPRLVRAFNHGTAIHAAAVSPDDRWIVTCGKDQTLRLWGVESGEQVRTFDGHTAPSITVAFSTDGGRLLSSGWGDTTVRLWDVATGNERHRFEHSDATLGAALSPDGARAATSDHDATLRLWDVESGDELRRFDLAGLPLVRTIAFSPDGSSLLTGSLDGTPDSVLRLWDVETGLQVRQFAGHSGWISGVAFSLDGERAISSSWDHTVRIWDIRQAVELRRLSHPSKVETAALSRDGRHVLSGGHDGTIRLWDSESGAELMRVDAHAAGVWSVAFLSGGRFAMSAGQDGIARLWDLGEHASLPASTASEPDATGRSGEN